MHESPPVRKAACAVLAQLQEAVPKGIAAGSGRHKECAKANPAPSAFIPKYRAYSQFFQFLMDLQPESSAKRKPYLPFRPGFNPAEGPAILDAAEAYSKQLAVLDRRAELIIDRFRQLAAPSDIYQLDALRVALQVHQMVTLRMHLGPAPTAEFESFLRYEIFR